MLGKPEGADQAREMLRSLRGRDHFVFTAICLFEPASQQMVTDLCATRVWMRAYTDEEIEAYIASGDPFDKAGAYAIQNAAFHPVERIEGCYACVMGLPVCHVVRALKEFGLEPANPVTEACPSYLEMDAPCLVYRQVLADEQDGSAFQPGQDRGS